IEVGVALDFESFGFSQALEILGVLRLVQNLLGAGLSEVRLFLLTIPILDLVARLLEGQRRPFVQNINDSRDCESAGNADLFTDIVLGERARRVVESRIVGQAAAIAQVFLLIAILEIRSRLQHGIGGNLDLLGDLFGGLAKVFVLGGFLIGLLREVVGGFVRFVVLHRGL